MAPLEAMACGCIVVGSNISGIKDILEEHQELLFQPGNIEDLMKKLNLLRSLNPDDTQRLKDAMRQTVLNKFMLDEVVERHEDLYKKLIR